VINSRYQDAFNSSKFVFSTGWCELTRHLKNFQFSQSFLLFLSLWPYYARNRIWSNILPFAKKKERKKGNNRGMKDGFNLAKNKVTAAVEVTAANFQGRYPLDEFPHFSAFSPTCHWKEPGPAGLLCRQVMADGGTWSSLAKKNFQHRECNAGSALLN